MRWAEASENAPYPWNPPLHRSLEFEVPGTKMEKTRMRHNSRRNGPNDVPQVGIDRRRPKEQEDTPHRGIGAEEQAQTGCECEMLNSMS